MVPRTAIDRRAFLSRAGSGLAQIALLDLLAGDGLLAPATAQAAPIRPVIDPRSPLLPRPPHHSPRARRVLVIFCSGALSQVDTFDFKPELIRRHGEPLPGADKLVTFQGEQGNLVQSPYAFRPRGQCGKHTSDLLPRLGALADEMCFVHSLTSSTNTHGPGEIMMSTGFTLEGFPSMGSWVSYALGSESQDLPAFVAIPDPRGVPQTGTANWSAGFLPAVFQGTAFSADRPIAHLRRPAEISPAAESDSRELLRFLNEKHLEKLEGESDLAARVSSYELAARMQMRAAEVADLSRESPATRRMYCTEDSNALKAGFGRGCLLARRLLERGVRFVQVFNGAYAMGEGVGNWDGHKMLKDQYDVHGPILDQPAAALLEDLKRSGMLADTLVVFTTEFGRMPTFQKGANGRDHNPKGFTAWLAGAGVKHPFTYGATDEFGYQAVDKLATIHDLHATILHILGLDHERLTYYHNGLERRLTDVHGNVLEDILS